jgi:cell division septation protein DedD
MEHRVRDLDQIQEDDGEDGSRRIGALVMAAASVVGLTLAVGVVVTRAAEPAPRQDDPLAKLEHVAAQPAPAPRAQAAAAETPAPVEAAALSFPSTLADDDERPEVLAALQAAATEEAALSAPAAPHAAEPPAAAPAPGARAEAGDGDDQADADHAEPPAPPDREVTEEKMVARIPAAVAGGTSARSLQKVVERDPLVAAAIKDGPATPTAPHGHDGEFTLQVISYDNPEPSRAFAEGLRAKGHMAFVMAADIPERGRYWRVRVGPFKTREAAEAYRRKFEDQEHMNTFVVREKPENEALAHR